MKPIYFLRDNDKRIKFIILLILILLIISIVTTLLIGIVVNKGEGKINISDFLPKFIVAMTGEEDINDLEEDITYIDLTGLITGTDSTHNHIYEKKYDSSYHWEQCWMCNDVINKKAHTFAVQGIEGCSGAAGYQTQYCTDVCGYSEKLPKKQHVSNGVWRPSAQHGIHLTSCSVCGNTIESEECRDSSGQRLGCTAGTCVTCGQVYGGNKHGYGASGNCSRCGTQLCIGTTSKEIVSENTTRIHYTITPNSGVDLDINKVYLTTSTGAINWTYTIENRYKSGNSYHIIGLFTSNSGSPAQAIGPCLDTPYTINGVEQEGNIRIYAEVIYPDNYTPTKNSITNTGNGSIGNFSRKATVTATYTDTWNTQFNMVSMRLIYKDKSTPISNWSVASQNGTTYTQTFDVTAEIREPENIYVQVKDICNNTTILENGAVTLQYIDALAPRLTEGKESGTEWSKNKKIIYKTLDKGVGEVQIAFNDEEDFQLARQDGDIYTRTYNFTGDVYGSIQGALYMKDALGNIRAERVTISNIDNTAPTITNVTENLATHKDYAVLTVTANDENQTLKALNKTYIGSGIVGYAITTGNEIPSKFQSSNNFNVTENGTYYLWAKDAVGNISQAKAIMVEDLAYKIKIKIDNRDNETRNIIQSDAEFTIYEWNNTTNQYIEYISKIDGQKIEMQREDDKIYMSSQWLYYTSENEGKFRIIQTQAPNGYYGDYKNGDKVNYDVTITEEIDLQTVVVGNEKGIIYNKRVKGTINTNKIDKETNRYLAQGDGVLDGAIYGLYASEDIYHQDGVEGKIYSKDELIQMKAIENGELAYENLEIGEYYIKEITPPKGYILSDETYEVNMNYEGETVAHITKSVIVKEKVIKQGFRLQKINIGSDETEADPLKDAGFKIYLIKDLEGVKSGKIKADTNGKYNPKDFIKYDFSKEQTALDYSTNSEGERIPELFTNEDGQIISPELAYGKYVVIESTVPLDSEPIKPFIVTIEKDSRTPQNQRYFIDKDFEALIRVIKKDAQTGETVINKNAKYRIWSITENKYIEQTITYPQKQTYGTEENPYEIDENGEFITPLKLQLGEYELREISAPEGYILNGHEEKLKEGVYTKQPKAVTKFNITTNTVYYEEPDTEEFIIDVEQYNDEMLGELEITKTGECLTGISTREDGTIDPLYEEIGIQGSEFEIYAKEDIYSQDNQGTKLCGKDELVRKITTNAEGKAYLDNLPIGKYYVKEVKAGEGLILNKEIKEFEIEYQGEKTAVQKIEMSYQNERQKVNLNPNDNGNSNGSLGKIEIEKIADKTVYRAGEEIIYTIKVSNTTQYSARNIKVTETIIGKFEDIQTENIRKTGDKTVEIKELKAGESVKLKFIAKVKSLAELSKETKEILEKEKIKIENNIKVIGDVEDPEGIKKVTETEKEEVYISNKDLIVVKEALKEEYVVGEKVQYVIKVINNGQTEIKDIVLEEKMKEGKFVYVEEANKNGVEVSLENKKIKINKLEPGEMVALIYEYTITGDTTVATDKNKKMLLENKVEVKGIKEIENPEDTRKQVTDESTEKIEIKEKGKEETGEGIIKQDLETGEGIEGAVIGIYTAEDIKGKNGNIIIEKNTLIQKVTTNAVGKAKYTVDLPLGKYYIKEIESPKGYKLTDETIEIDASYEKQDIGKININKVLLNRSRGIKVAKENEKGEFLSGAKLQVIDERGEEVDTWKTREGVYTVRKLEVWKTYRLREIEPARGYTTAEEIKFKIDEEENLYYVKEEQETGITVKEHKKTDKIEMVDQKTKVKIEVVDPETGETKEGVKVEIIDSETSEIIYEFETKKTPIILEGLPIGEYEIILIEKEGTNDVTVIKDVEIKDSREIQELKLNTRKKEYNVSIEKTLSSVSLDGEDIKITDNKIVKIELKTSQAKKSNLIAKYNIKVTNKGGISTKAKVLEMIPKGYEVLENPGYWEIRKDGDLEAEVELKAGESKDLSITLKWINGDSNLGIGSNTAKLEEVGNGTTYTDTNAEDDTSSATIVIGIKTGYKVSAIIVILIIVSLGICGYIMVTMNKKNRGETIKRIRYLMK